VAAVAAALLAGSYLVLQQQTHLFGLRLTEQPLEPEALLQLYILLAAIADPVRKLSSVFTRLQSGAAASDRIFAFVDRQPRVHGNSDGPRLTREALAPDRNGAAPCIEFHDVCFSYEPDRPILTHVNLRVRAGETVALVGQNGCGKTTLESLLP